jgi:hypothetical protein
MTRDDIRLLSASLELPQVSDFARQKHQNEEDQGGDNCGH